LLRKDVRQVRKVHCSRIVYCTIVLIGGIAAQEPHTGHSWDYGVSHGPSHWGDLEPDFATCKTGHHQSPIDIRNPKKADLPTLHFDYKPSPLHIVDNGHTIMINYEPGSSLSVGENKYTLKQFHFHRPSEEKINGKSFEMTLHLVHADSEGKLAVVAVLLQEGKDNPLVRELWKDVPKEKEKEAIFGHVQIDVSQLVPSDHGYYTFSGSLTTPPCSEDVTWFVLKHPMTISHAEVQRFSKLYRNDARPTQPLYDRTVLESH
jgi:carbonic anhydrase